jgi:hypothetical protein
MGSTAWTVALGASARSRTTCISSANTAERLISAEQADRGNVIGGGREILPRMVELLPRG